MLPLRTARLLSPRALHLALPRRTLTTSTPRPSVLPTSPPPAPPNKQPTAPSSPSHLNPAEADIHAALTEELAPSALEVQDISGGCGSMYALSVTSERFRGLSVMKQHRLVNAALGERIKGWHGVQIRCFVPEG